jgi:hypothetical protein
VFGTGRCSTKTCPLWRVLTRSCVMRAGTLRFGADDPFLRGRPCAVPAVVSAQRSGASPPCREPTQSLAHGRPPRAPRSTPLCTPVRSTRHPGLLVTIFLSASTETGLCAGFPSRRARPAGWWETRPGTPAVRRGVPVAPRSTAGSGGDRPDPAGANSDHEATTGISALGRSESTMCGP